MRYAIVSGRSDDLAATVSRYLPRDYKVICSMPPDAGTPDLPRVLIGGTDEAGWTFDDYVRPRLASGLYHAAEISESLAQQITANGGLSDEGQRQARVAAVRRDRSTWS